MKSSTDPISSVPTWLELNDAARLLGVHFTTLRRWADEGQIPHMRTPGGRRRFSLAVLEQFLIDHEQTESKLENIPVEQEQAMLLYMRSHMTEFFEKEDLPIAAFSPGELQKMRLTGRRLLACLMQFLSDDTHSDICLREARFIARDYGALFLAVHMNVSQMIRAFLFFRRAILEVIFKSHFSGGNREANVSLFQHINQFTDEILLEISESFGAGPQCPDSSRGKPCP